MKFLLVKTSSLGDIVHSFPVAQYLKNRYPGCEVDWVLEESNASLVNTYPYVDHVFTVDTRSWRRGKKLADFKQFRHELSLKEYNAVFDLQGNLKSGIITSFAKAPDKVGFSRKCVAEWPNLLFTNKKYTIPRGGNVRQDYLNIVQQYFQDTAPFRFKPSLLKLTETEQKFVDELFQEQDSPKIMVCPGAAWKNKRLQPEKLKRILIKLHKAQGGHFFFIWGNPEEKATAHKLQHALSDCSEVLPRLPLPVLQNVMDRMDLVIGMDSLPLHLAGLTSARTYGIFGPSSLVKYGPVGERHAGVQGRCPYKNTFEKRCPLLRNCPTAACIKEMECDDILSSHFFYNK